MRSYGAPFSPVLDLSYPGLSVFSNYDLTKRTSMRMKSQAAAFAEVNSPEALRKLLQTISDHQLPSFVLGGGKNTLFATSFFEGVVYSLGRGFGNVEYLGNNIVRAGGAVQLPKLIASARQFGLMGLEFLTMVPGTVGGSLAGNAGAGGWGLCDFAERVLIMTRDGFVASVERNEFRYSYRHCDLREVIVLEADFRLEPLDVAESMRRTEEYKSKKANQPYDLPSCGCIFKNPKGPDGKSIPAGKLIDEAGLKGYALRGAMVSEQHANFMVNAGESCGEDFLAMIGIVRDRIYSRLGIELELEVQIVGGPLNTVVLR